MSQSWKELPTWKEADTIYQRWKKEEFDIDAEKARRLHYVLSSEEKDRRKFLTGKPKISERRKGTLLDIFTACISDWSVRREGGYWLESASDLIDAYTIARGNGLLTPGLSMRRGLQERERQIADLSADLQQTKANLGETVRKLKDCNDRTIALETENQKLRERNPVFGIAQGSVDEVGENASKKEDEE